MLIFSTGGFPNNACKSSHNWIYRREKEIMLTQFDPQCNTHQRSTREAPEGTGIKREEGRQICDLTGVYALSAHIVFFCKS